MQGSDPDIPSQSTITKVSTAHRHHVLPGPPACTTRQTHRSLSIWTTVNSFITVATKNDAFLMFFTSSSSLQAIALASPSLTSTVVKLASWSRRVHASVVGPAAFSCTNGSTTEHDHQRSVVMRRHLRPCLCNHVACCVPTTAAHLWKCPKHYSVALLLELVDHSLHLLGPVLFFGLWVENQPDADVGAGALHLLEQVHFLLPRDRVHLLFREHKYGICSAVCPSSNVCSNDLATSPARRHCHSK